ncbi:SWIM zinc finger [Micrococcales bacterium KH10]|nr:SWIM zinc finger [Micrococcales bacterium KH10]
MFSEADVRQLVGVARAARGASYAAQGMVTGVAMRRPTSTLADARYRSVPTLIAHVKAPHPIPYLVKVTFAESQNDLRPIHGDCSCRDGQNCKHVAAALVAYLTSHGGDNTPTAEEQPVLPPEPETLQLRSNLGLQFKFDKENSSTTAIYLSPRQVERQSKDLGGGRIGLRPIIRSASGRWLRTGLSWQGLVDTTDYAHDPGADVLRAIHRLGGPQNRYHHSDWVWTSEASNAAIWSLLLEAHRVGVEFVEAKPGYPTIEMSDERALTVVTVDTRDDGALLVSATLQLPDQQEQITFDTAQIIPIGNPAVGVIHRDAGPTGQRLTLVATARPVDAVVARLLAAGTPQVIEASRRAQFFSRSLSELLSAADTVNFAEDLDVPATPRTRAAVQVVFEPDHKTLITVAVRHRVGDQIHDDPLADELFAPQNYARDPRLGLFIQLAERNESFAWVWHRVLQSKRGAIELSGLDTATFAREVMPTLTLFADEDPDFDLEVTGESASYDILADAQVTVSSRENSQDRDWFDLNVTVQVAGRQVPLPNLFTALARGDEFLLVDGGGMLPLSDPRLQRLRELIEQAGELRDTPTSTPQVSRYHTAFFDELSEAGYLGQGAESWRQAVGALAADAPPEPLDAPRGLNAELRHYQHYGFEWLAYRAQHRLGALLADDMGLGKTLQTIATFLHLKDLGLAPHPFLVVAPTSVVDNWVSECARFAPSLKVVAIHGTAARRRIDLATAVAGADVVVTSYALLRLESDEYQVLDWSGAIFDEAQFIKNHRSQGYEAAVRIHCPFKIALTGTPLENNVMELWSLITLTCPGLLPGVTQFNQDFARPIARGKAPEALARLRRAISPFLLRRTKDVVAADLPEKVEQVTEVVLNTRHRRVYDRYLQRERAKVLGLIDNLDGNRFEVLRSLTLLRQASLDVSLVDEAHEGISSSKLDVLWEMLDEIIAEGHNVLIFSQFTRYLSKVRDFITERGIDTAYLDGKTRNRARQIARFTDGEVPVFLISLKAGGFGLNLTNADYCILLDPWWNPATEAQAVDRAHRIGQTRNVMVYRLVASGTIESKVMALKQEKSVLFSQVVDGTEAPATSQIGLSADDIQDLLA